MRAHAAWGLAGRTGIVAVAALVVAGADRIACDAAAGEHGAQRHYLWPGCVAAKPSPPAESEPSGPLPGDLDAAVSRAVEGDATAAIRALETALTSGGARVADVIPRSELFVLHEDRRFRALMAEHARDSELTLVSADEPGRPILVSGTIRDHEGEPVEGALIYVYHTNAEGTYSSQGGNAAIGDSLNPRIFGYLRSDAKGRYAFRTIWPGEYRGGGPPRHIHYEITVPGSRRQVEEIMFDDDPRLDGRTALDMLAQGMTIVKPAGKEKGVVKYEADFRLEKPKADS